jgi:osmoprotectant transport system permease protein
MSFAGLSASRQPWVNWAWVQRHNGLIRHEVWEHVLLTVLAVGIGLIIAGLLAVAARAYHPLTAPLLALCGVIYAVPSIALFALLVPVTGFTTTTAEIGLVGYTLLILLRNILVGLDSVEPDVKEAARGMGYGRLRLLVRVEFPLALPAIFAGLRIATVTTIGLVTVTSLIGQGGLGYFLLDGFQRDFRTEELLGAALAVLLAFAADVILSTCQRVVTPWSAAR